MTFLPDASSRFARARRLHREAANCLTLAVGQKDLAFAGELIDEAMRLTRRARELAA
ncbi:hypothetical protein [Sphingomonas koreensis]|uniref:hypothetical protein n=1 Tax=Sphingomonas koreensis TaxID=93064 RepID=UPI000B04CD70|nr:hypothetical protein [Sphingomonas koreensis]MDC7811460.1 hypothetical protein [Sphingomonas koreensis]